MLLWGALATLLCAVALFHVVTPNAADTVEVEALPETRMWRKRIDAIVEGAGPLPAEYPAARYRGRGIVTAAAMLGARAGPILHYVQAQRRG